jgi:hypothetical protein
VGKPLGFPKVGIVARDWRSDGELKSGARRREREREREREKAKSKREHLLASG